MEIKLINSDEDHSPASEHPKIRLRREGVIRDARLDQKRHKLIQRLLVEVTNFEGAVRTTSNFGFVNSLVLYYRTELTKRLNDSTESLEDLILLASRIRDDAIEISGFLKLMHGALIEKEMERDSGLIVYHKHE